MSPAKNITEDGVQAVSDRAYGCSVAQHALCSKCLAGALLVGVAAGIISVVGFAFLTPLLERSIGLGDTCGVHNLHGIPGILGGLVRLQSSL